MQNKSCLITLAVFSLIALSLITAALWSIELITANLNKADSQDSQKLNYSYKYGNDKSTNKLLSISINGMILDSADAFPPIFNLLNQQNYTYGYQIKNQLGYAADDPEIKGVILEINSPGGTINGSKAISDGIEYYKQKTKNPVYAHISGMGASGAYWVASSADSLGVDFGSLTGSIGVIMGPFKYYDKVLAESGEFGSSVSTENGIETFYMSAGTNKDFGNPYKPMPKDAKDALQKGLDNEYENFVKHVATKRNITEETIKTKIGAMPYDNTQAIELGLADYEGSKDTAFYKLAEKAGFNRDDFQIVSVKNKPSFIDELIGASTLKNVSPATMKQQINGRMLFLYGDSQFLGL